MNSNEKNIKAISDLGKKFSDSTIFMHEAIAKKAGLSGTDHKYLNFLIQYGAITAGRLSELTGLSTGAITGLVDRLEKKKFVKRKSDSSDRRKILIVPNLQNISKVFGSVSENLQYQIIHLINSLAPNEVKIIEKYLTNTIEIMDGITYSLNPTKK